MEIRADEVTAGDVVIGEGAASDVRKVDDGTSTGNVCIIIGRNELWLAADEMVQVRA